MRPVFKFFVNWASELSVITLTIASIAGASEFIYLVTKRAPQEDISWLLDYSSRCVVIALAITFTSVSKEAFGHWIPAKDLLDRPLIAAVQSVKSTIIFLACLYVLTH